MLDIARRGRPFMMNVQSNAETLRRIELYRDTLRGIGCTEAAVAEAMDQCWVWRNVCVAETDAEAARIAVPAFEAMQAQRAAMRERVYREQGVSLQPMPVPGAAPAARTQVEHSLIYGSPTTVAEALSKVKSIGIGGVIMQFRLGPMSFDDTAQSLTLFQREVMPMLS
jgi:alkanesulfonate monooxygenase SsuD/methylene tetrahydromethanopterin reductase-like flavin-dependent oxidoreductase (luciferase family)